MLRLALSPVSVMLVLALVFGLPQQASGPPASQPGAGQAPTRIPLELFQVPDGFEVTLWAATPLLPQSDQHRHRQGRPHLGRRGRPLPLAPCPPARGRSHRRAAGHRRRRHAPTARTRSCRSRRWSRRSVIVGHRQQDRRLAAARPHRLHRRRSQPAVRSGGGHARGAADRLPGHQSRPLAALGDRRPRRQVGVQLGQHGGDVHRPVGEDVPHLQRLSSGPRRPVQVSAQRRRVCRQAERRRPRVRRRVHGAHESRRHQRRDHRPQLPQQLRAVGDVARRRVPERQRRPAGVPRELGDGVRQLRLLVERRPADVAGRPAARPVDSGRRVAAGRSRHRAGW